MTFLFYSEQIQYQRFRHSGVSYVPLCHFLFLYMQSINSKAETFKYFSPEKYKYWQILMISIVFIRKPMKTISVGYNKVYHSFDSER